jgi:hypothetical protein
LSEATEAISKIQQSDRVVFDAIASHSVDVVLDH